MTRGATSLSPHGGLQPLAEVPFEMPFVPGEILAGKYEVVGLLGAGGMGFVVSAIHLDLGEPVALKFLRPEALANEELVARFAREARASARIKCEYVARVFDVGTLPDGAPYIVMEYLAGKDLNGILGEQGPLSVKLAVEYLLQGCEALASAHASGVVHRDIKPENLFLAKRAQGMDIVKVLDFGISKVALTGSAFESKQPLVRTIAMMGSPFYMSPEQIRASDDVDARTDIWSLGCVLYELLTATPAFSAPTVTQTAAMILESRPLSMRSLVPEIPVELEAVVDRCLEKDRDRRFQNVAELAIALYPFAPRRGRISAERCSYIMKSAGISQEQFELPSVSPPSWNGSQSGLAIPIEPASAPVPSVPESLPLPQPSAVKPAGGLQRAIAVGLSLAIVPPAYLLWHKSGSAPAATGVNTGAASLSVPLAERPSSLDPIASQPDVNRASPPAPSAAIALLKPGAALPAPVMPKAKPLVRAKAPAGNHPAPTNNEIDVGY